jgi:hypothetical protein
MSQLISVRKIKKNVPNMVKSVAEKEKDAHRCASFSLLKQGYFLMKILSSSEKSFPFALFENFIDRAI